MLIIHADDYGINMQQCKRILHCREAGRLNSVSIFGNSTIVRDAVRLLDGGCLKSIHLNFLEGKPVSDQARLRLLVNKEGYLYLSFQRLLWLSIFNRKEIEDEIYRETKAQIRNVTKWLGEDYCLRIDSHQHYHMIPAVFRGVLKAIKECRREVAYIRIPRERLSLYVLTPEVWKYITLVNFVKVIVLKLCILRNKKVLLRAGYGEQWHHCFIGVLFAGKMRYEAIYPLLKKIHVSNSRYYVEVLFHPGGVLDGEDMVDRNGPVDFYRSKDRELEAKTLIRLRGI